MKTVTSRVLEVWCGHSLPYSTKKWCSHGRFCYGHRQFSSVVMQSWTVFGWSYMIVTLVAALSMAQTSLVPRLFSPPVFDRFQYEIRRGKAWEIWSCAMTSGRHTGVVPNNFNTCFVSIRPRHCEQQTASFVCLANTLTSSLWTDSKRQDIEILRWAPPSTCLPCVYLMAPNVTRSPRPSPPYFILEVIKYWRWEWPGNEARSHHPLHTTHLQLTCTQGLKYICIYTLTFHTHVYKSDTRTCT